MQHTIYLLDDDILFLEILSELLSPIASVTCFHNIDTFLETIAHTIPSLAIIDLDLKDSIKTGLDVVKEIHTLPDSHLITLIILTASVEAYTYAFQFGIDDFFQKPIIPTLFLQKIKNTLFKNELKIHTNALTGLPGIKWIETKFNTYQQAKANFVVAYLDLDNFKPFNDEKGVKQGDLAIKLLSQILKETRIRYTRDELFVGHLGGDDFFILGYKDSIQETIHTVYKKFEIESLCFFSSQEQIEKGYWGTNRKSLREFFPLLTISTAIISISKDDIISFLELSELVSGVKKEAKLTKGNSIVEVALKQLLRS